MPKYKLKAWAGPDCELELELDTTAVARLASDPELNPQERARAEAFLAKEAA